MIFQYVQNNFAIMGISKAELLETGHRFNTRVLIGLHITGLNMILHGIFIYRDAHEFHEYTESIYMTSIATFSFLCCVTLVYKIDEMLELIDMAEKLLADTVGK